MTKLVMGRAGFEPRQCLQLPTCIQTPGHTLEPQPGPVVVEESGHLWDPVGPGGRGLLRPACPSCVLTALPGLD